MKALRAQSALRRTPSLTPIQSSCPTVFFFPQKRAFTPPWDNSVQTLHATRTLPYTANYLYSIIADVDQYSTFLPYCSHSRVTKWSKKDPRGNQWPMEGELRVGWAGLEENFRSKVFCEPNKIVEAVAGDAETTIPREKWKEPELDADSKAELEGQGQILSHLLTRWTITGLNGAAMGTRGGKGGSVPETNVELDIEFKFSNPMYAALSQTVAPKVASVMIEAFETRARKLMAGHII